MYRQDKIGLDDRSLRSLEVDEVGRNLLKAAQYIREHGHCKHSLFQHSGEACLRGAIIRASKLSAETDWDNREMERVSAYLGLPVRDRDGFLSAVEWNNADERTASEVIAALEAAAFASPAETK